MKAVLPGKPESRLQALATGYWDSRRITVRYIHLALLSTKAVLLTHSRLNQAYITGSAIAILGEPQTILQTIYDDNEDPLEAIALDEASGKIAVCTYNTVRIYKPFGQEDDALRVCCAPSTYTFCCRHQDALTLLTRRVTVGVAMFVQCRARSVCG